MKPWIKTAIVISLSLMFLFCFIGYAALTQNLFISGIVSADPAEPQGIYISKVEIYQVSGLTVNSTDIILPTNLSSSFNVTSQNARVTYAITVNNKTDMTYWYLGQVIAPEADPNGYIGASNGIIITTRDGASSNSSAFDSADWVPPHTERTFYATYTFGSRAQGNVSTLINFSFGLHMASFSDAFLKVLNDQVSEYGYEYLADAFEDNYRENGSRVIANIAGDEEIFNNLFGASLTVNMNGDDLPVKIVVERRNVDGKENKGDTYEANSSLKGCEYTVYITVDDLENNDQATVYAVSYTRGADGVWYMIGELYEGKCNVEQYENSTNANDLAFDVSSWTAVAKEYTVIGNLKYKVGYPNGETDDMVTKIDDVMSIFHQTFYNNINNHANSFLTKVCQTIYSFSNNNGQQIEYENSANVAKPGYAELKRAFDKLKPYAILDNGATNVRLSDKARELSRAEIIRLLEDINAAYEYYLAVNS